MRHACLLALASTGCIAMSVRAQTGVVADDRGAGVQAGVVLGFGYATDTDAGVLVGAGVSSGTSPALGVTSTIDYVRLRERLGWRAGFTGTVPAIGDGALTGLDVATLFPLRDHTSYDGSEKGFSVASRSVLAISVEAALGGVVHDVEPAHIAMRFGGRASLGLELVSLERWR